MIDYGFYLSFKVSQARSCGIDITFVFITTRQVQESGRSFPNKRTSITGVFGLAELNGTKEL